MVAYTLSSFLLVRHNYPNLHKWLQRLYWNNPAFKDTTDFDRTSFLMNIYMYILVMDDEFKYTNNYSCRYQGALLLLALSN